MDAVDLYAQLNGAGALIPLGRAMTGPARPDIGAYFGSQFTNSSWGMTASGLSPGNYLLSVYPHNTSINGATAPSTVWVTVGSGLSASAGPMGGLDIFYGLHLMG